MSLNIIHKGHGLRIAVRITVITILLLLGGAGALSSSGGGSGGGSGGSWPYYRDITISNPGAALTDYQVLVNLTGSAFPANAQAGGADIRFTDAGGNELSYWIESWDYAGRSARVWVKVGSVLAGATIIRMYYGNSFASSAGNGTAVFEFFDDFEGGTLNKWSIVGTPQINSLYAYRGNYGLRTYGNGANYVYKIWSQNPTIVEFRAKYVGIDYDFWGGFGSVTDNTNGRLMGAMSYTNKFSAWSDTNHDSTVSLDTQWHKFQIFVGTSETRYSFDYTILPYITLGATGNYPYLTFYTSDGSGGDAYFDDILVRKYASIESSVSVGAEQRAYIAEYNFIDNIDKAIIYDDSGNQYIFNSSNNTINQYLTNWEITGEKGWVSNATVFVAGKPTWDESKQVIVTHPFLSTGKVTGEYSFLPLQYANLTGYYANGGGYGGGGCGDGVRYNIELENNMGEKTTLINSVVTDYRNWHKISVNVSRYVGKNIKIRFIVDGRSDQNCDQSVWGDIKLKDYSGTPTIPTILDPTLSSTQIYKQDTGAPDHITISFPLSDADGIASATLYYRLNSGAWQQASLTGSGVRLPSGYEWWNATIGAFADSGTVTFYLNATDRTGLSARNPFDGSYHSFSVVAGNTGGISRTGLVGEWHFDGNASDSSGNGNHGTINGATFIQGVSGQALSFNGNNDYVNIGDPASGVLDFGATNSFTLAAFFNSNTFLGKTRAIISKVEPYRNLGYYLRFQIEDSNLRFQILDEVIGNPILAYPTSNFATGTWYYVVVVRDAGAHKLRLYVNGIEVASETDTSRATLANTGDIRIGSASFGSGLDNFNGAIDEVRIYNRALSASEIQVNYNATARPEQTPTPTLPSAGSVTRSIPTSAIMPGGSLTITLTPLPATLFDSPGYQVIETIPEGFTFVNTPAGYDFQGNVYTFIQMGSSPITYTLRAPSTEGSFTISGTFKDEQLNAGTVSGTTDIRIGSVVSRYAGSDGIVQRSEAVQAVMDYFNSMITKQEAISVVMAYFTG